MTQQEEIDELQTPRPPSYDPLVTLPGNWTVTGTASNWQLNFPGMTQQNSLIIAGIGVVVLFLLMNRSGR